MFVWFDHRNLLSDRRKTLRFCLLSTKELTCLPHCATCDSIDIPHLLNYLSASQMRSGQMTQDDSYCLISYRWTPIHETTYTVTLFQISKFESEISRPIHCLLLVTSLLPAHDCSLSLSRATRQTQSSGWPLLFEPSFRPCSLIRISHITSRRLTGSK